MFLRDGLSTRVIFALNPFAAFLVEKVVTPPGETGGGKIEMTNMTWSAGQARGFLPKQLYTQDDLTVVCQYDPEFYVASFLLLNQLITITFPDGSTFAFYGWAEETMPGENKEGENPTLTLKICASNLTQTNNLNGNIWVYSAPVYTAP